MKTLTNTLSRLAVAALALTTSSAIAAERPTIVLVHGAWEQSGIWQGVEAKLKADGYRAIAVSLPGRPDTPAAPGTVSLDLYRDTVIDAFSREKHPVVLVGHSFAGVVISAVGEAAPEKIKTLVYVAAYLPKDGQSLIDLGNSDKDSKIGPFLQIKKEQGIATIERSGRADLFCNDCPPGLRAAIPDLIVDEPLGPLVTPVHLTPGHFGRIDKVYIHTAKDQVVSPALQATMLGATPVRLTLTENTGHTPFLTDSSGLARAIEASVAKR